MNEYLNGKFSIDEVELVLNINLWRQIDMFNSIKSEYFSRLDSKEVQNGTSEERVLARMSR